MRAGYVESSEAMQSNDSLWSVVLRQGSLRQFGRVIALSLLAACAEGVPTYGTAGSPGASGGTSGHGMGDGGSSGMSGFGGDACMAGQAPVSCSCGAGSGTRTCTSDPRSPTGMAYGTCVCASTGGAGGASGAGGTSGAGGASGMADMCIPANCPTPPPPFPFVPPGDPCCKADGECGGTDLLGGCS